MQTFYVILLIILFGIISGLSGGWMLGYVLVKEMRRFEKKYKHLFVEGDK